MIRMRVIKKIIEIILRLRHKDPLEVIKKIIPLIKIVREAYIKHMDTFYTKVGSSTIRAVIKRDLVRAGIDFNDVRLVLLDYSYYLPTPEQFKVLTEFIRDDFLSYYRDVFDCDDFSLVFKAEMQAVVLLNNVGFVIGTLELPDGRTAKHSWNIVILKEDNSIKVYTYEPQTNTLAEGITANINGTKYIPEFILM